MSDDDLLVYPTEKVVGIVADDDTLDAVRSALADEGVAGGDVEVLAGESDQRRVDPDAETQGAGSKIIRTVQKALGDEVVRLEKLNQALDAGQYVVTVALSEEDDDARERQKQDIGAALHHAGATKVAFYGKYQIEELQLGA